MMLLILIKIKLIFVNKENIMAMKKDDKKKKNKKPMKPMKKDCP